MLVFQLLLKYMRYYYSFVIIYAIDAFLYCTTCIQRQPKGRNKSGPLQEVVFECRFYQVDLRMGFVSEQWSLKIPVVDCLLEVV